MKIPGDEFFHLTYCTNIHPGEDWEQTFQNIKTYIPPLKKQLSPDQAFGIGLRLADIATRELLSGDSLESFRSWLIDNGLYVFTLNGFPYGSFHRQRVKETVYSPDWTQQARFDYSVRLLQILAGLLPKGVEGGFSTSPISYKPWVSEERRPEVYERSCVFLAQLVVEMVKFHDLHQQYLHIDIEPEPDCLIENTDEAIDFFERHLLPIGGRHLSRSLRISLPDAESLIRKHVQLCYDICHFSVAFEDHARAFSRLEGAGIGIGKVQISAALEAPLVAEAEGRRLVRGHLEAFSDPVYLHQVRERAADGSLKRYPDLPQALECFEESSAEQWRTHFHVPIFVTDYDKLSSTQEDIITVLRLLREKKISRHLEIETYTWEVLPDTLKLDLSSSIQREYQWVLEQMTE